MERDQTINSNLEKMHHVAIPVKNISRAVDWYSERFKCEIEYQDKTWALLKFQNIKLALVKPDQHPPHIAFESDHIEFYGKPKLHRDGTRSTYIRDSEDNTVEYLSPE
jgi:catechol 2,3-dioxygenase-like lactoylglutathione lyase family enzyme